jgi:hypothetical protein
MPRYLALCALTLCAALDHASAQAPRRELPMAVEVRFDPAHIQADQAATEASTMAAGGPERLGLLSTALLFEATPGWWLGPVAVGAASGQRGGFFVLGAQIERRWRLADAWRAQAGLMAGGGGGAGAPVGGGLMLQPLASVLYDWGPVQTGLSWSRVGFPGGRIGSQQWGLVLSWDGRMGYFDAAALGGATAPTEGLSTGLGLSSLSLHTASLRMRPHGDAPASTAQLAGVRAQWARGPHLQWGLEAAAATHGGADGYMELLATAAWSTSARAIGLAPLHLGARAGLGMGGGGAAQTGGGTLGKLAAELRWDIAQAAFVGLEAGQVQSPSGGYRAHYMQWQAGLVLDRPPGSGGSSGLAAMEWSASLQRETHAARKSGAARALDTLGIKLRYGLGPNAYLTGQAHSAFAGGAGAYSLGLAGLGWRAAPEAGAWHLGAELLAGAAGGGGVATQGGAVAEAMAYVGHATPSGGALQLGVGRLRSQRGGLNSPVVDLSWTQRFGVGAL